MIVQFESISFAAILHNESSFKVASARTYRASRMIVCESNFCSANAMRAFDYVAGTKTNILVVAFSHNLTKDTIARMIEYSKLLVR